MTAESKSQRPPSYEMPLYMRLFPNFFSYFDYPYTPDVRPQKRDAFEDFLTLYAILGFYGAIRPNHFSGGFYWQ